MARRVLVMGLVAMALFSAAVVGAPSAAAHDPNCLVALHAGPVKEHVLCDGNDHEEMCLMSFNFMFIHQDIAC